MSTIHTIDQWISNNAARLRLNIVLLAVFAIMALLIAAIGIFGVLTYSVNQGTRDWGADGTGSETRQSAAPGSAGGNGGGAGRHRRRTSPMRSR